MSSGVGEHHIGSVNSETNRVIGKCYAITTSLNSGCRARRFDTMPGFQTMFSLSRRASQASPVSSFTACKFLSGFQFHGVSASDKITASIMLNLSESRRTGQSTREAS